MPVHVLGGDIGGTKTDLAIFEVCGPHALKRVHDKRVRSREHDDFHNVLDGFVREWGGRIDAAGFGVAGPVINQSVQVTNLPWYLERQALAALLKTPHVLLLNDLAATAYGAVFLPDDELCVLNAGDAGQRTAAVIAAGTGLGQALLIWDGKRYLACPSEGGHGDFAARNETEIQLLQFLLQKFERVSVERALSGPGLRRIFEFVDQVLRVEVAAETRKRLHTEDAGKVIGEHALAGTCEAAARAVDLFLDIYGAQAGNLALTALALGGIFVGGGPAVKLLPRMKEGGFIRAFTAKGRFEELMHGIPVRVILNPRVCQVGAAQAAADLVTA